MPKNRIQKRKRFREMKEKKRYIDYHYKIAKRYRNDSGMSMKKYKDYKIKRDEFYKEWKQLVNDFNCKTPNKW